MLEYAADWQESLVQRAEQCARSITYVAGELIRERFRLGGIVVEALERSQHGDAVVVKMAERMSAAVGKCIRPHMLYESARIYNAFGGQWERIEALRAQLSFPLSYSYLVRFCLPALTMDSAWNAEQVTYSNDSELRALRVRSCVSRRVCRLIVRGSRKVARKDRRISKPKGSLGPVRNPQNFKRWPSEPLCGGLMCCARHWKEKLSSEASNWRRRVSRRRQSRGLPPEWRPSAR